MSKKYPVGGREASKLIKFRRERSANRDYRGWENEECENDTNTEAMDESGTESTPAT